MKRTFCAHMYEKKKEVKVRAELKCLIVHTTPTSSNSATSSKCTLHPVLTVITISNVSLPKDLGISDNLSRA